MDSNSICGIVVTFHPDAAVAANLDALRAQVDHLIAVDNGSTSAELAALRLASSSVPFELIENGDNLGIATALNIGVRRAQQLGYPWLLLFDQDSTITPGCAQTMLHAFQSHPAAGRIAIMNPRYVDSRFGMVLEPFACKDGVLETAITSASLMPASIFTTAGYFADELFIDGVDYEYSFRVRSLGFFIARCAHATVLHSPGTPSYHSVFGSKKFHVSNYSPVRRYYQERNKIWVARRYGFRFARFMRLQFRISLVDFIKIILVEQDRWTKVRFFLRGIFDGLRGRMHKYRP